MKRDDAGLTLVEVLICLVIMSTIMVALTTSFFAANKAIAKANYRMADTHDGQMAASYFTSDMQSADSMSTTDTSCGGSTPLISFTWFGWSMANPPVQTKKVATYVVVEPVKVGDERQLLRMYC